MIIAAMMAGSGKRGIASGTKKPQADHDGKDGEILVISAQWAAPRCTYRSSFPFETPKSIA